MEVVIVLKKLIFLVVVFAWALAHRASADLVAFWEFEDGDGGVIKDSSGNGYNGMMVGGAEVVTDPVRGQVLRNIADGGVDLFDVPNPVPGFAANSSITLAAWVKPEAQPSTNWDYVIQLGRNGDNPIVSLGVTPDGRIASYTETDQPGGNLDQVNIFSGAVEGGNTVFESWHHIAVVYDRASDTARTYIDGVADATTDISLLQDDYAFTWTSAFLGTDQGDGRFYVGLMDDVAVFDHALTEAEIQGVMQGLDHKIAENPQPADAVVDQPRDVTLEWEPGEFAVKHTVYLGTDYDEVSNAATDSAVLVGQDLTASSYDAGILDFGQTYYWRVDEVNGAPDRTVFKGDVWSFEVEPFSIPVETITATASSSNAANMGPENTINGVGLNELDQHSTEGTGMWLSGMGDPTPSIQYEFDKAYKLHEMLVWNSNQLIESFVGIGAKDVVVETSVDGATWTVLEGATLFNQATGTADYTANTAIDLAGVMAKYIKITVNAGWGIMPQYGLSEVRFTYIPVEAREAQPAHEAAEVAVRDAALSWRAGREAVAHEVYLSTDPDALELIGTTTEPSYAATLDLGSTYYWQIVEVNNAEAISAWAGEVWTFSTEAYIVIDNFENYNDDIEAGETIYLTWVDGYEKEDNGSQVGYTQAPFAEETIIHGGAQSMPLIYDTAGVSFAETVRTFDPPQNWTLGGAETLTLFFRGQQDNTGQLYAKINGVKVPYDGGAEGLSRVTWQTWNIDLVGLGTDLTKVQTLVIGIEGASASGTLFVDDIHLYKVTPMAPREPDSAHMVAHYALEGDVTDRAGNGHDGDILGDAGFVAGMAGQALSFDGADDFVRIPDDDRLNPGAGSFSCTLWANLDLTASMSGSAEWDLAIVKRQTGSNGYYIGANRNVGRTGEASFKFMLGSTSAERVDTPYLAVPLGEWVFIAAVLDRDQNIHKISTNGGSTWATATPPSDPIVPSQDLSMGLDIGADNYWFHGTIDELRLYDTALTDAEVMWLANDL
jgi:hypothetical protein